ncbi:uncharacterized protein LOC105166890 isoform X2 [Sesamum indicum]|uniref:Uncharacterized protein LOC105166890 isoform X2 n=1 Tax=Sesamum indicum TaxID=4182 RepID=A0A6I9TN07_SESIN|nr:uncharacterized protein LOC105166890 isoform X2 [Sesamum indicum]
MICLSHGLGHLPSLKWNMSWQHGILSRQIHSYRGGFAAGSLSSRDSLQLAPMPESYDLDRGLLLAVQAIQALLENKGLLVIVGIGCKIAAKISSSSHAQKLAIAVQTQGRRRKRYTLFSVFVLLETLLLFQVVILPYAF